jgi:hypothetical protein
VEHVVDCSIRQTRNLYRIFVDDLWKDNIKINLGNRSKRKRGRGYWLRIMS